MSDTRVVSADITKVHNLTAYANYSYAKINGYDFKYLVPSLYGRTDPFSEISCKNPRTGNVRHAAWTKILSIYRELKNYDTVIYLDSDAYFNNVACVYVSTDHKPTDPPIKFLNDMPWFTKPSSGFVMVDACEAARNFLIKWYSAAEIEDIYDTARVWEQCYIQQVDDAACTTLNISQYKLSPHTDDNQYNRLVINHVSSSVNADQYDIIYQDVEKIYGLDLFCEIITNIIENQENYSTEDVVLSMYKSLNAFNVSDYAKAKKYKTIVKIGANDARSDDPFKDYLMQDVRIKGLLVEPVEEYITEAKQAFKYFKGIECIQTAVAASEGCLPFYYLDDAVVTKYPDVPKYYRLLGSFDSGHIHKHFGSRYDEFIITKDVPVTSLMRLIKDKNYIALDILHIDTEGYDWQILKQLDLSVCLPKLIYFEHKHLQPTEIQEAVSRLSIMYHIVKLPSDFVCVCKKDF